MGHSAVWDMLVTWSVERLLLLLLLLSPRNGTKYSKFRTIPHHKDLSIKPKMSIKKRQRNPGPKGEGWREGLRLILGRVFLPLPALHIPMIDWLFYSLTHPSFHLHELCLGCPAQSQGKLRRLRLVLAPSRFQKPLPCTKVQCPHLQTRLAMLTKSPLLKIFIKFNFSQQTLGKCLRGI